MQKRILNFRPTWDLQTEQTTSSNYYPVVSALAVVDTSDQLTIMTSRAQGGTVTPDGRVELMQHRRMLRADSGGMTEPLNEMDN